MEGKNINIKIYFSDFFNILPEIIEKYGAFNISLINDLPLFIDPFRLFNSKKEEYQELHNEILDYLCFLKDESYSKEISEGLLNNRYCFPEIRQNWLGYSKIGNHGSGLGPTFGRILHENLNNILNNFGQEQITKSSHLEKLCIIKEKTGRDNISDFTTNLIKRYLLEYTEKFAKKYLQPSQTKEFAVNKVYFNYETCSWVTENYILPIFNNDYVILTPRDILTKDATWINRSDLYDSYHDITIAMGNNSLRDVINDYFRRCLPERKTKKGKIKEPTKKDISKAISKVLVKHPELYDYYIKFKEDKGDEAEKLSTEKVIETEELFIRKLSVFIHSLYNETDFYSKDNNLDKALVLKDFIENNDVFFSKEDENLKTEKHLNTIFRIIWFATDDKPNDFSLDFKLASNEKLEKFFESQISKHKYEKYKSNFIKVILYSSLFEFENVNNILREVNLESDTSVIFINISGKEIEGVNEYNMREIFDIAIICALNEPEFRQARNIISNIEKYPVPDDTSTEYYKGTIKTKSGNIKKIILASNDAMGMPAATTLSMKILYKFNPKYLVMTGICAGVDKNAQIGDILIPEFVWDYGSGKYDNEDGNKIFKPYAKQLPLDTELEGLLKHLVNNSSNIISEIESEWHKNNPKLKDRFSVKLGPFASGSAVVAYRSMVDEEIKKQHGKLLGFDMEAYGVFYAVKYYSTKPFTKALVIKSICDLADENKNIGKDSNQNFAAFTSARYLYHLIYDEVLK